jgi:hypothetical protein
MMKRISAREGAWFVVGEVLNPWNNRLSTSRKTKMEAHSGRLSKGFAGNRSHAVGFSGRVLGQSGTKKMTF